MKLVLAMLAVFLLTGVRVARVDRWVVATLALLIGAILLVSFLTG